MAQVVQKSEVASRQIKELIEILRILNSNSHSQPDYDIH